ncbi:conserved hypothetical protein [Pediculus humanus corporis]|uniref:Leucine zipper transcription factor-like protein 1 n=1 Tax=Pediculus humanus subsp. corporis TaxID=121224 RepID=E0VEH7_PEDHC|nr:uncharacterized protein Phum_PHUM133840 [Pediculus humanus corporis]EEB11783.1 conserved hypothetical protein [Pediculus humanus corporis]
MGDLGLNQHHQSVLISYMKFAKYMRNQILKQVNASFQDTESRLYDDTFTKEEIKEIIGDLEKIIQCDVESELINFSHNNVLLLKQIFKQAEKWYLRLDINLSESQNQEELEMIKLLEFDEGQFASGPQSQKTEKEIEEGSIALLKMEIERLNEENMRLSNIIQDSEDMTDLYKDEKNKLGEKLLSAQKEITNYKGLLENLQHSKNEEETIKEMEEKLIHVENLLSINIENLEENENIKDKLKIELMSTKEKELEKKFSETKAYANMKQILMKKNEQIKELRRELLTYQSDIKEEENDDDDKVKDDN